MRISTARRNSCGRLSLKICREEFEFPLRPSHTTAAGGLCATDTSPASMLCMHWGGGPVSAERFLGGRVIARQPEKGFRAGLDAVMLAAAVPACATALELGAGAGTASLCLAARLKDIGITGLEIDPALVEMANENAAANGMADRVRFASANIFALPLEFKRAYDWVFLNPPFHGEGQAPPDPDRARALMDEGTLLNWLEAGLKRAV